MDFGKTVFLFISILGIAWWVGTVMKAEGEDKYQEACQPVTITTKYLIKVTTALTGFTPKWTQAVKKKLDSGCYYFFATFMFSKDLGESAADGGIRMYDGSGSGGVPSGGRSIGGVHR